MVSPEDRNVFQNVAYEIMLSPPRIDINILKCNYYLDYSRNNDYNGVGNLSQLPLSKYGNQGIVIV